MLPELLLISGCAGGVACSELSDAYRAAYPELVATVEQSLKQRIHPYVLHYGGPIAAYSLHKPVYIHIYRGVGVECQQVCLLKFNRAF